MEKEERERQELEANGRREEQSPRERSVAIPPRRKGEGQREEVHVTEGHLEYESKKEHVPGRSPRPPERWELADERDSNGGGRRDLQEGPNRECDRVGQKREGHEEDGDDREIAELVRQPEDRVAAGVEGRAAQEVLAREPVRTEVIPGGQRASHEHRGAECEDRDDDPGGPDEAARGHGPVTSVRIVGPALRLQATVTTRHQAFSPWYLPLYPSAVGADSRKNTSCATRAPR